MVLLTFPWHSPPLTAAAVRQVQYMSPFVISECGSADNLKIALCGGVILNVIHILIFNLNSMAPTMY